MRRSLTTSIALVGFAVLARCTSGPSTKATDTGSPQAPDRATESHPDAGAPEAAVSTHPPDAGNPKCVMPGDGSACDGLTASLSSAKNPSGTWSYGWAAGLGKPFAPFDTFYAGTNPTLEDLKCWSSMSLVDSRGAHLPVLCANSGAMQLTRGGAVVEPGRLLVQPSVQGQYAIARWTPPAAGVYHVYARFTGLSGHGAPPTTVDVHVQGDGRDIESGYVNLYGGGNTYCVSSNINLSPANSLDFTVGSGNDASASDATDLEAFVCKQ